VAQSGLVTLVTFYAKTRIKTAKYYQPISQALKIQTRRKLKYLGNISIALLSVLILYLGYSAYAVDKYQDEIKELLPNLFKNIPTLDVGSFLGEFKSCPKSESNEIYVEFRTPIEATLKFDCVFKNGNANILLELERNEIKWNVVNMVITSDLVELTPKNSIITDK